MSKLKKLSLEDFSEIKAVREGGMNSTDIAKEFGINLKQVNQVFNSKNYDEYGEKFFSGNVVIEEGGIVDTEDIEVESGDENVHKGEIVTRSSERYRGFIADKREENSTLTETTKWLIEQVKYLRKYTKLLEIRKKELEDAISGLEKELYWGIGALESLEDAGPRPK